ncbi:DUF6084 family protein [Salinactinospora qingdaonensis]|uniref:DUF6084 family protein n=1 Tax=Salinactinospora qingdaonensis TaxID=702744 RepID=A0ABP7FAF6_9ACTN
MDKRYGTPSTLSSPVSETGGETSEPTATQTQAEAAGVTFECRDGRAEPYAATPTLSFRLRITEAQQRPVHNIALRCEIQIQPRRRRYGQAETERLHDLFGVAERWSQTLRPLRFADLFVLVPGFNATTEIDLRVPCTYDFEVSSAKYFHALDDGEIPLLFLFSGTVFRRTATGFTIDPVPWDHEASYDLPVRVWQEMMDLYFPDSGWMRVRRDTLDAVHAFKTRHTLPNWDDALLTLLDKAGEVQT